MKIIATVFFCLCYWMSPLQADDTGGQTTDNAPLINAMGGLTAEEFEDKESALTTLLNLHHPLTHKLVQALLDERLAQRKEDERWVLIEETDDGYKLADFFTGEALGEAGKRDVRKVGLNNAMRGELEDGLARLNILNPDAKIRLDAVTNSLKDPETIRVADLYGALKDEKDAKVAEEMRTAIALKESFDVDDAKRMAAIETLSGSLNPLVLNRLHTIADGGNEPTALRDAARKAAASIEARVDGYHFVENLFFGLSLGSVLLLAAIGLAITFGVIGVINMAHGELMMLGAYTAYVVQQLLPNHIEWSLFIAIPAAFLISGLVGILIQKTVIQYLHGRTLETLLATFGISLLLQQLVRSVFSPLNRAVTTPEWMSGSWQVNEVFSLTYNRLYIILFALAVFAALLLIMKKTRIGLEVRAISQNRNMARAVGVRASRVDALAFGLGSGIAGVAGVALSQLTNVGPNLGQSYIIDSFMVVVFGGVGNLWGTLVGAMSLGVLNKFLEPWAGAMMAKILVLVAIILFIQKRPRGLFPQKGRAVEG